MARQWIRHRTANVNEYSARYSILDREFYIPAPEHWQPKWSATGRVRGAVLQGTEAAQVLGCCAPSQPLLRPLPGHAERGQGGEPVDPARQGLARELARMNLTLNTYTQWYWKIDLYNLLHFLSLRADPHAQHEIRAYAAAMLETVQSWVPIACQAFVDYRLGAVTLSQPMLAVVRRMLAGETVPQQGSGLNKREWAELTGALGRMPTDIS